MQQVKKFQRNLKAPRYKRVFVNIGRIVVNDFTSEKSAPSNRVLVVTELVFSGTKCTGLPFNKKINTHVNKIMYTYLISTALCASYF